MTSFFLRSGWGNTATIAALALLPLAVIADLNSAAMRREGTAPAERAGGFIVRASVDQANAAGKDDD